MSSRHVRKVLGSGLPDLGGEPASEDDEPVTFTNKKRIVRNPYELLNEVSESEAKEDDGQPDICSGKNSADSCKMEDHGQANKKKKKKKKAGKNKKKHVPDSEATEEELDSNMKISELRNNQGNTGTVPINFTSGYLSSHTVPSIIDEEYERIFKMEYRYLNTEFELRKIFGSRVLNLERERGKRVQRRNRNTNLLILPKDTWPPTSTSGLSMKLLSGDKFNYWKFTHSAEYQSIQKNFIRAVDSLQIESVMAIMKSNSYHIDSHIQMSEIARSGEDMQVAAELIETALHGMEAAFDSHFAITSPRNRVEYKYQENRSFYILLFKHLMFVGQRACYRTALELCKRLLTLDPENDPLCAILMIDFYAIKSNENKWLIDLFNYWEPSKNLSQLPNFAYSLALASQLLYIESQAASLKIEKSKDAESSRQSNKNNENSKMKTELEELSRKSDEQLQYALLMFPAVVRPLMEKCSIQGSSRVLNHPYFNSTTGQTRALKLLSELYVWRCHHIWRDQRISSWLEKNFVAALDLVDAKDSRISEFEERRKRRYQGTPRNIIRHVLLTDNQELTINLPPDLTKEAILNYDPLPPLDSVNIYGRHIEVQPANETRHGLFNMLVNSFLFDLNAPGANNPQRAQNVGVAGDLNQENRLAPAGVGLQQSVTALLDAMRDLLTNVHPRAEGEEDADGGDESDGDT